MIKGGKTRPAIARLLTPEPNIEPRNPPIRERQNIPTAWLELTLTEGKNRQVRRMTAAVGHPTLRLIRVAIGKAPNQLTLENLALGEWRHLTEAEIKMLRSPLKNLSRRQTKTHRHRQKTQKKSATRRSKKRR